MKRAKVWDKPFVRGRKMLPTDVGLRFEDTYGDGWGAPRFGIAVAIEGNLTDHHIRDNWVEYTVIDAAGHRTDIHNCFVELP